MAVPVKPVARITDMLRYVLTFLRCLLDASCIHLYEAHLLAIRASSSETDLGSILGLLRLESVGKKIEEAQNTTMSLIKAIESTFDVTGNVNDIMSVSQFKKAINISKISDVYYQDIIARFDNKIKFANNGKRTTRMVDGTMVTAIFLSGVVLKTQKTNRIKSPFFERRVGIYTRLPDYIEAYTRNRKSSISSEQAVKELIELKFRLFANQGDNGIDIVILDLALCDQFV